MNKLILIRKDNFKTVEFQNVLQLDFCNMQKIEDDISDSGWNFITIITKENGKLFKHFIKLEDIWQFSLVKNKE